MLRDVVERRGEQISERCEAKLYLRLRRPARHDAVTTRTGAVQRFFPDACLADSSLALDKHCKWAFRNRVQHAVDRFEFVVSTHERPRLPRPFLYDRHPPRRWWQIPPRLVNSPYCPQRAEKHR